MIWKRADGLVKKKTASRCKAAGEQGLLTHSDPGEEHPHSPSKPPLSLLCLRTGRQTSVPYLLQIKLSTGLATVDLYLPILTRDLTATSYMWCRERTWQQGRHTNVILPRKGDPKMRLRDTYCNVVLSSEPCS